MNYTVADWKTRGGKPETRQRRERDFLLPVLSHSLELRKRLRSLLVRQKVEHMIAQCFLCNRTLKGGELPTINRKNITSEGTKTKIDYQKGGSLYPSVVSCNNYS